ncbi:MAG: 2-dehydropantoate 2-reductase [Candidatus Omnitrophica bacterium]|nr:2-dehydropantoate 2-reductase [Candidatus Omnitrophota bacterium]
MRVAIIGGGAIGSVVAAQLSKAKVSVYLVGRKDHVEAIRQNGLQVESGQGTEQIRFEVGTQLNQEYDLVIFATKTQDLKQAYQENQKFLGTCLLMTSQNGVQADQVLKSLGVDEKRLISSIVLFGSTYTQPGQIVYNFPGDWIIGSAFGANEERVAQVAEVLKKAFSVVVSSNIVGMKWLKLFINFNNCIPAMTGKSMQETFADQDLCRLSILLLREGVDVVKKAGIELVSLPSFPTERIYGLASMPLDQAAEIMHQRLTTLSKQPLYGSILQSILRGKASEIDYINGEVALLAERLGISAPLNRRVVELVHQVEEHGKFLKSEEIKKEFGLSGTTVAAAFS